MSQEGSGFQIFFPKFTPQLLGEVCAQKLFDVKFLQIKIANNTLKSNQCYLSEMNLLASNIRGCVI